MWRHFWPLCSWLLLLCYHTTIGYCTLLYDDLRLAAFTVPDYRTSFILRSNNGSDSFKEVQTGHKQMPFHVRVYAKVLTGVNAGFCFEGVGSAQVSARKTSYPSGGIVFAYDKSRVRIWAPSQFKGKGTNGSIVSVNQGWGNERYSQTCDEALVVVEVWYIGPSPTFQTNVPVDTQNRSRVFVQVDHQLAQIPERVLVRVTPDPKIHSPNEGFWFNAITASQNVEKKGYGGVIFAYDEQKILLWLPSSNTKKTGCVFVQNGWGDERYTENTQKCIVHIFAWVLKFPMPTFKTEWNFMISQGQSDQTFLEIDHMLNMLPALVVVQGRIGDKGLIFEATGAAMSTDSNSKGYGGILFAYDKNRVRIWLPKRRKGHRTGYSILVKTGWGSDQMLQKTHKIRLRVIIYTSNCDPQREMVTEKGICKSIQYNSYQWTAGPWGKCSSICNKGVNHRDILACSVSKKETVLKCGFGENMCNWQSVPSRSWARVKDTISSSYHNFGWNLPADFYHAFAVSNGSGNPVRLVSPKFPPRHSCTLTFLYKMYGIPPAILSVHVSEEGANLPKDSGWTMYNDQGGSYWRQGYVKLSNFPKLNQIIFGFTIAHKPEPNFPISYGKVSVDDVRLVCERIERTSVDTKVCKQRKIPSAGCIHPSIQPIVKGPAYDTVTAMDSNEVYVVAKGLQGDLIASYEFQIHVGGEYSIWLLAYGTSLMDNGVTFKIDDLDFYYWQTTFIEKGMPIWTQYMYETFALKPGVHTVHLLQYENKFKYSHIALTPKELLTWVPLGMQSRYIPDSALNAYPPSSLPDPKFGRLNGFDAWCSSDHNPGYVRLEIALPQLALVSRIAVQGGHQIKRKTNSYWVTLFAIQVSVDGKHFSWYRISDGKKMFDGNLNSNGIVEHELPFAVLVKKINIFPHDWQNWICMRVELYGVYMTENMCAAAGEETATTKECQGDRNCSLNADCKPMTNDSIIKTGLHDSLKSREACHCHNGYHGDSCEYIGCDPNPCQREGECQEEEANFTCICQTGYHGSLCQWPCPVGKYGKDCAHTCLCGTHGSCNVATGHCSCDAGYYGMQCEFKCPRGYYGIDCKQRCQCQNNGDCDHMTGTCNCTAGWTGQFCDLPCSNNTWGVLCQNECLCSDKTLSCNPITGECICKPGFTGKTCNEACPAGRYGSDCAGICRCSKFGRCHQTDGSCICATPGYTGTLCDQPCPHGYTGAGCKKRCVCAPNAECSSNSDACKCGIGFSGPSCTVPCQSDRWGPDCKHSCQCQNNATCDSYSGECKCLPGWHGPYCSNKCPYGAWSTSCDKTCDCSDHGSCNPQSGKCECKSGWTGSACNISCPTGSYGHGCQYRCNCVNGVECKPDTGQCICPPGWSGYSCAQACQRGKYGKNCASNCSCQNDASCDHVLGTCSCRAGWTGDDCSQTCPEGFFGLGCSSPCQCRHSNGKSCDAVTGKCQCGPGYLGPRCSRSCKPGLYGQDCLEKCRCLNGAECRPTDGRCLCLAGFFGDLCEHQCLPMTYGVNCTQRCDSCSEGQVSSCNHVTGKCLCLPGYYGYHCENECPEGQYGQGCKLKCDCAGGASCNHVDGTCECPDGLTGDRCEHPCAEGRFGTNCEGVCLCENGAHCDKVNGKCECLPGFTGTRCMDQCPDRRWGLECRYKCSCEWNQTMRCRGDTGQCLCHAGYRGKTCRQFCDDGTYGQDCKHPCPVCSRHVTGPCYKIDGRCPCSPGYRGHLCDNDCLLKNFGKNCEERCKCDADHVCHHVNGECHPVKIGKFQIIIKKDNYTDFEDVQRRKQLKLHVATLISKYHDMYEELRRVSRRQAPSQSTRGYFNATLTTLFPVKRTVQPVGGHDLVARILDHLPGSSSDGSNDLVVIDLVMFDGYTLLNGSIVKDVISSLDEDVVSEILGSCYYSGELYSGTTDAESVYVQLITGIAGGLLLCVLLTFALLMCRKRRRYLRKLKLEKKRQREAEKEMELKTRGFRHNGYRLAFDNPYYDVVAAMAIDDDVEEDYINPLCDLDSLMSHQESDGTVSSATECSIHKGESLQSVSYC